jgi:hypothetical protein
MMETVRIFDIALGVLLVIVLAIGPEIRGFKLGRGRWIFKGDKTPQQDFLPREGKAVGRFNDMIKNPTAMKKCRLPRQNRRPFFAVFLLLHY